MSGEVNAPGETPVEAGSAETKRNGSRWKALAVLAAVFVFGGVAGAAVGRITALREMGKMMEGPPPEARARFRLEAMRRHLKLRDDQVERVRAVLAEADTERDQLMASCGPQLDELRQRTDAKLRAILDEEQQKRYDEGPGRKGRFRGGDPPPHPGPFH